MRTSGITRRWIMNTLSVIVLILVIVNIAASLFIKSYYYQMAENTIDSKVQRSAVQTFFRNYTDSSSDMFAEGAREFAESFGYSYLMDLWVLDSNGNVIYDYAPHGSFKAIFITSPLIKTGEKYSITIGHEAFETEITAQNTVIGTQPTGGMGFGRGQR